MKIDCEVIAVRGNGETLTVKMQGTHKGSADWRPMSVLEIELPETRKTQKSFHMGRRVSVQVLPK